MVYYDPSGYTKDGPPSSQSGGDGSTERDNSIASKVGEGNGVSQNATGKQIPENMEGESDKDFEESMGYYERAGLIDDYIGELEIGIGKCIIISEDVPLSTWISNSNTNGTIVVANYINEEINYDILSTEINKIPDIRYNNTGLIYRVTDYVLYLFPACDFGTG